MTRPNVHGMSGTDVYMTWKAMKQRCAQGYSVVCERWNAFENFYADMGDKPDGMSIERIDNSRGYEPSNCKWATATEQSRNRSFTKLTVAIANEIITKVRSGRTQRSVGEEYNIAQSHVSQIMRGLIWQEAQERYSMADNEQVDLGSVFEFAQDIATQDAPPPLPPKTYVGEITAATAKRSPKGNTYIEVEWTIQPDQFPLDYAATQKDPAKLYYRRLVVSPDTDRNRYSLRKFSEAIRAVASRRIDINDWIGKVANLKVKTTKYMGEDRAEIDAVEMV